MYYKLSVKEVLSDLHTSLNGLPKTEAKNRLIKYGKNEITRFKKISKFKLLISQVKSFIVYVLIVAALISLVFGEYNDAIVIGIVVIVNALLGFFQEYKAEKAIEALQKLSSPNAIVIRDGKPRQIPSTEVVPGDVLVIEEGSFIPADARLFEVSSLAINESTLTGESAPVNKNLDVLSKEIILASQKNMVFAGTIAVRGRGKAVVVFTGLNTEMGKIAKEIQLAENKITPLQRQLSRLGKNITVGILVMVAVIFIINHLRGASWFDSFFTSVALAVAAIPEGLPAVITITLALGTQRMLKRNALVRKLSAVETLGSTSVICADKTGTLTKNEMTIKKVYANNKLFDVTGSGYDINGNFLFNRKKVDVKYLERLFSIASLCNNATIDGPSDPTEKALIVMARKGEFDKNYERIKEIPFSSEKKYMITVNRIDKKLVSNMKGAPEVILSMCRFIEVNNKIRILNKNDKENILKEYKDMASKALRVLAFAYSNNSKEYIFVGLAGMIDPPREEVKDSIAECYDAGIRVVMITGDYEITAKAIASQIGIDGEVINGEALEKMSSNDLSNIVDSVSIYARVNPEHKVKILEALKSKGYIVAMTGDGVNDALALKKSDIGTAVGSGTDVAKQASDMVLLDDNFVSIVHAVKEGRGIYCNIKKFIKFLFSTNLAEVLIIFLALIIGLPLPLIAIQILWINLLTDGLPALALGVDPVNEDVMKRPPRKSSEKIINKNDLFHLSFESVVITFSVLFLFYLYYKNNDLVYAQTVAFSTLVFAELFNALSYRLGGSSIFSFSLFKNKYLWCAIALSVILQFVVVYILNDLFETVRVAAFDWVLVVALASLVLIVKEPIKLFRKIAV
ncbi:MAG TPA: cation-translocating P-type ATPase [Candidatus Nanoarchaeia archaeon]|nr:cation-translocating P-type ATPase [Candidatus Nanoarchaeia archaeon]